MCLSCSTTELYALFVVPSYDEYYRHVLVFPTLAASLLGLVTLAVIVFWERYSALQSEVSAVHLVQYRT